MKKSRPPGRDFFVGLFLPVGGVLVGVVDGLLVAGIDLVGVVGLAVGKVDAQLALKVVGGNGVAIGIVMGHAVERAGEGSAVPDAPSSS